MVLSGNLLVNLSDASHSDVFAYQFELDGFDNFVIFVCLVLFNLEIYVNEILVFNEESKRKNKQTKKTNKQTNMTVHYNLHVLIRIWQNMLRYVNTSKG